MNENENNGLSISEDKAEALLKAREQKINTVKEEILNSTENNNMFENNEKPAPPFGIKTAADLKATNKAQPEDIVNRVKPDLGKASIFYKRKAAYERTRAIANEIGMKVIPLENLPSGGLFYEPGTEIAIRAARVEEIRHFSTIDETDIIDIDDKLNYIIERCARIRIPGKQVTSYKDILELDRFYLVFAIRELTFSEGENKIQMKIQCNECNNIDVVDIKRDHFHLVNLDERLQKYFNPDKRCFTFETKTGESFDMYFPTLGVTEFIKRYIRIKAERGQKLDQAFLTLAPFLFSDWRKITDETFNNMNHETLGWSLEKISVMMGIIDILRTSSSNEIIHYCSVCGSEVRQPISFQGGYKSLFIITDIFERLI